jgi:tetratricopeptide (TPR) repeat protein
MRMERYEEAKSVQEQAVEIFRQSQHPRFVPALALLGAARQATNEQGALLKGIATLPKSAVEQLATEGPELLERFPNRIRQPVLLEIAALVTEQCGATSPVRLNLLAQIANNETEAGAEANHEVRLLAAQMSYNALKETGDVERIIQGLMGLAYAQTEAGSSSDAEDSYRKARLLAEETADYGLASQVARNHGLSLAEQEERERAEPLLRDAVALAGRSGDRVMLGRSECALGIFLQHGDRHEEAEPLLEAALEHLPATEADAIYARSHYTALQQGGACGCDQMEGAFFENYCLAIREQVEKEMPGLLKSIVYKGGDGEEAGLQVEINRKPTEKELERLHIVVTQAEAAFRQRMIEEG